MLLLSGCDGGSSGSGVADKPAAGEPATEAEAEPVAAEPTPAPMPAVDGAAADEERRIHVQLCAEALPCPKLLQAAAETHCKELDLGGTGWRLPTRDEAKGFKTLDGLAERDGFHWTSTAFADDDAQRWIYDPASGSETTVPKDRKNFTARCVRDAAE